MSVSFNSELTSANLNNAFASKSNDNTLSGQITLDHADSGSQVSDLQQVINNILSDYASKTTNNTLAGDQTISGTQENSGVINLTNSGSSAVNDLQSVINDILGDITTLQSTSGGGSTGSSNVYIFTNQTALNSYTSSDGDILILNNFEFDFTSSGANTGLENQTIYVNLPSSGTCKFDNLRGCNLVVFSNNSDADIELGDIHASRFIGSVPENYTGKARFVFKIEDLVEVASEWDGNRKYRYIRDTYFQAPQFDFYWPHGYEQNWEITDSRFHCRVFHWKFVSNIGDIERQTQFTRCHIQSYWLVQASGITTLSLVNSEYITQDAFMNSTVEILFNDSKFLLQNYDTSVANSGTDYDSIDHNFRFNSYNYDLQDGDGDLLPFGIEDSNIKSLRVENNKLHYKDWVLITSQDTVDLNGEKVLYTERGNTGDVNLDLSFNNCEVVLNNNSTGLGITYFVGTMINCDVYLPSGKVRIGKASEGNTSIRNTKLNSPYLLTFANATLQDATIKLDYNHNGTGTFTDCTLNGVELKCNDFTFTDSSVNGLEVNGDQIAFDSTLVLESKIWAKNVTFTNQNSTSELEHRYNDIHASTFTTNLVQDQNITFRDSTIYAADVKYIHGAGVGGNRFRFQGSNVRFGHIQLWNGFNQVYAGETDLYIGDTNNADTSWSTPVFTTEGIRSVNIRATGQYEIQSSTTGTENQYAALFMADGFTDLFVDYTVISNGVYAIQGRYWSPLDSPSTTRCQFFDSVNKSLDNFNAYHDRDGGTNNYIETKFNGQIEIEVSFEEIAEMIDSTFTISNPNVEARIKRVDSSNNESWVRNGQINNFRYLSSNTKAVSFDEGNTAYSSVRIYYFQGRTMKITTDCSEGDKFSLHADTAGFLGSGTFHGTKGMVLHPFFKITRLD